jgi:ELWxxDGT repeat protein
MTRTAHKLRLRRDPRIELLETRTMLSSVPVLVSVPSDSFEVSPNQRSVVFDGENYFVANDGITGAEVWKAGPAGLARVADLIPGSIGSSPQDFVVAGDSLYFTALTAHAPVGRRLWKLESGGVEPQIVAANAKVQENYFAVAAIDDIVYFTGWDEVHGYELWRSDGTDAGTYLVKDLNGLGGSSLSHGVNAWFTVAGQTLYFVAGGTFPRTVWATDGTAEGTISLDVLPDVPSLGGMEYFPNDRAHPQLTAVGGSIYFVAQHRTLEGIRYGLFRCQDPAEGVSLVTPASGSFSIEPMQLGSVGDTLYFSTLNASGHCELWKIGNSDSSAVLVKALGSATRPHSFENFDGTLMFSTVDLWRSDGSPEGTHPIATANPGYPHLDSVVDGVYYFNGAGNGFGAELWRSDGTGAGTYMVADLNPGTASAGPHAFARLGDKLYFIASGADNKPGLWSFSNPGFRYGGDYNGDNSVNGSDFLIWQRQLGKLASAPGAGADGSGDGAVSTVDFVIWTENFGRPQPLPVTLTLTCAEQDAVEKAAETERTPSANAAGIADAVFASGDFTALFSAIETLLFRTSGYRPARR